MISGLPTILELTSSVKHYAVRQEERFTSQRRRSSPRQLVLGSGIQTEVALHAAVPGFVVAGVQIHPFLIRHSTAPLQERNGVGSHGVAELPCPPEPKTWVLRLAIVCG
jgi:hypothetical protein